MRAAVLIAVSLLAAPAAAFERHTALVLRLDAWRSVDAREHDLQRRCLADALRDPDATAAISPAPGLGVAAFVFEWSDPEDQVVLAPWTILDGLEAIDAVARALLAAPEIEPRWKTGLGDAMHFAADAHRAAPADCKRRVVDISGDGPGDTGAPPSGHRAAGAFAGLTINGLVIRTPKLDSAHPPGTDPMPSNHEQVIQGPGAFVVETRAFEDYPDAIRRKLLREPTPLVALK